MCTHLRVGRSTDGRLSGLPVHLLAGCAVRLDRTRSPDAVPSHPRQGRCRPMASGGWHVGRARHEPAERREHRAATGLWAAVLRVTLRDAQHGDLDTRRLRLPSNAAADLPTRWLLAVRHPEAELEQAERVSALDLLVGGARRIARAHALPTGRHVQRGDHARRSCPRRTQLQRAWLELMVVDAVRSRKRRRWTDARDDGTR